MFNLKIQSNSGEVERMLKDAKREHPQAAAAALNRTAITVRSRAIKFISTEMELKQKFIRGAFKIKRATATKITASIDVTGNKGIQAIFLQPSLSTVIRPQPGKGISFQKSKSVRAFIPGGFVAKGKGGHIGIFQREGTGRLPIELQRGPSIPALFRDRHTAMRAVVTERFPIEFRSALKFFKGKR